MSMCAARPLGLTELMHAIAHICITITFDTTCRWLVFAAFPVFIAGSVIIKVIVLFKRGVIADKEVSLPAFSADTPAVSRHSKSLPLPGCCRNSTCG